jgi:2-polyprenyl-3-methyl-5-hydroxy-6-metoxy-1,4-benzoquinol methylase
MNVSWRSYDESSERFFHKYEELTFSRVHRSFLRFLPQPGANCLDIGSGSGRDAIALAKRGYNVFAVEPSDALRELAATHHRHPNIRWIKDHLPSLNEVKLLGKKYSFILLSAVWMHVHPSDRNHALATLASLLADDGYIGITIRSGPDTEGRGMYPVSVEELRHHAAEYGLISVYLTRSVKDAMQRTEVSWKKVVLAKKGLWSGEKIS